VLLHLFLMNEGKLIAWLFGFAVLFGGMGAGAVYLLIRRDRDKS
jgi:hypothetical protein